MATPASVTLSKVVALLTTTPSPAYSVYARHAVADLDLPSITVEIDSDTPIETDKAFYDGSFVHNHAILISIRIHTSYSGGVEKFSDSVAIVDSVVTTLNENLDLADGYRTIDFNVQTFNSEFAESKSVGAELKLTVHKVEVYNN